MVLLTGRLRNRQEIMEFRPAAPVGRVTHLSVLVDVGGIEAAGQP
jgi:hypothetical protein